MVAASSGGAALQNWRRTAASDHDATETFEQCRLSLYKHDKARILG